MLVLREERLPVWGEIHGGTAGTAQGPAAGTADLPLVLPRGGESGTSGIGPAPGNGGCFPVQPRDGGCREVLGLRRCEGGAVRPRGRGEALRALLRERGAGRCMEGGVGVMVPPALLSHKSTPAFHTNVHSRRAIACMGAIDIGHPASNSGEIPTVPAQRHYTAQDNGLVQPWAGQVFLNPPFGPGVERWFSKWVKYHSSPSIV